MIHVYTGNGKGKSTAAFGLAMRARGAGKKVFIGQFLKKRTYSELKSLKKLGVPVEQFGRGCFIRREATKKDILCAQKGLKRIRSILVSKRFDLVILDEINVALSLKLLSPADVLSLVPLSTAELVLTGRGAPPEIIAAADLVSEMREVKHYYASGVKARRGIEF